MPMNTCKYCGTKLHHNGITCGGCGEKLRILRRFVKARDKIRRKTGLPPLEGEENEQ